MSDVVNKQRGGASVPRAGGVGPYRFGARLKGLKWPTRYLGEVYRVRNRDTEAPELVLMRAQRGELSARIRLRVEPEYLALRVATPEVPGDLSAAVSEAMKVMKEARETLAAAAQRHGVLDDLLSPQSLPPAASAPAGQLTAVASLDGPPVDQAPVHRHPRRRAAWARWGALASVTAAAGLAIAVRGGDMPPPPPSPPEEVVYVPAGADDVIWADIVMGSSASESFRIERRIIIPPAPLEGQRLPPCTEGGAVEINGGCWWRIENAKPPCEVGVAEHKGGCWIPVPTNPKKKPKVLFKR